MEAGKRNVPIGTGWVTFAGVMFLILGTFSLINGVMAIAEDEHLKATELFFGDIALWGLIHMAVGIVVLITGLLIFQGRGRLLGIFIASLDFFVQVFVIGLYTEWALIMMIIDAMIIYALTVYGGEFEDEF